MVSIVMDWQTFAWLRTPAGQESLAWASARQDLRGETLLRHLDALRKRLTAAQAAAVLDTVRLRRRAAVKFTRAGAMYFTRAALEQATAEVVARYRACRFAGYDTVCDLGCGIGGDTLALAAEATRVVALDRDPLHLAMLVANAEAYGVAGRIRPVLADVRGMGPGRTRAAFFDPARRDATGRRAFTVAAYEPPLSIVHDWLPATRALGVKVSPGVRLTEIEALGLDPEVEFVSVAGELREAALWFGSLHTAARRATLLPEGHTLVPAGAPPLRVASPGRFLIEPDPAVYRAGLLAELAERLGAWQLDATIAYLSADALTPTPFARAWAIEEALPFGLKEIRRRLRARGVGSVTVKKRGSPLDVAQFERLLRLDGSEHRTVILTRVQGQPMALICHDTGRDV